MVCYFWGNKMSTFEIVLVILIIVSVCIKAYCLYREDSRLEEFIHELSTKPLNIAEVIVLGKKCGLKIDGSDPKSLRSFYVKLLSLRDVFIKINTLKKYGRENLTRLEKLLYVIDLYSENNDPNEGLSSLIRVGKINE